MRSLEMERENYKYENSHTVTYILKIKPKTAEKQ